MEQLLTLEAGYSEKQLYEVLLIEYTATSLLEGSIMDWGEQFWSQRWSIGYLVSGQKEGIRWWKHLVQGKALGCNHLDARLYYQAKQVTLSPLPCRMLPQASWEEIMASVNTDLLRPPGISPLSAFFYPHQQSADLCWGVWPGRETEAGLGPRDLQL